MVIVKRRYRRCRHHGRRDRHQPGPARLPRPADRCPGRSGAAAVPAAGSSTRARWRRAGWRRPMRRPRRPARGYGSLGDLAQADLVIEAVFEDFDLKARLLDELSPLLRRRGTGRDQHELPAGRRPRPARRATRAVSGPALFQPGGGQPDRRGGPGRSAPATATVEHGAGVLRSQRQAAAALPGLATALPSTASSAPTPTRPRGALDDGLGIDRRDRRSGAQIGARCGRRAVRGDEPDQAAHQSARDPQSRSARDLLRAGRAMVAAGEADRPFAIGAATALPAGQRAPRSPTGCCAAASCRCCRRSTRTWPSPPRSTSAPARR